MGYADFCQAIESIASAQRQIPGYRNLLGHVRDLTVWVSLFTGKKRTYAVFEKKDGANFAPCKCHTRAGNNTNWADLEMIRAFVKAWMEEDGKSLRSLCPIQQDRFMNVLWLLGTHLKSD